MKHTTAHEHGTFYWEAGSGECPHGPEPDHITQGELWDAWRERHPSADCGPICLDAPAGRACLTCSEEQGDMVPWRFCEVRVAALRERYTEAIRECGIYDEEERMWRSLSPQWVEEIVEAVLGVMSEDPSMTADRPSTAK